VVKVTQVFLQCTLSYLFVGNSASCSKKYVSFEIPQKSEKSPKASVYFIQHINHPAQSFTFNGNFMLAVTVSSLELMVRNSRCSDEWPTQCFW